MSLKNCITKLHSKGIIDDDKARSLNELYDELETELSALNSNPEVVKALASRQTVERLKENALLRQRRLVLQTLRDLDNIRRVEQHVANDNSLKQAAISFFTRDLRDIGVQNTLEKRRDSLFRRALSMMEEEFEALDTSFSAKELGRTVSKPTQRMIMMELDGIETGNAKAKSFAQAFQRANEFLKAQLRASGGMLRDRADWGLQHLHNRDRLLQLDNPAFKGLTGGERFSKARDLWVSRVNKLIEWNRMGHPDGKNWTYKEKRQFLRDTFDGLVKRVEIDPRTGGPSAAANKYLKSRALHFRQGTWNEYNDLYGDRDIIGTIVAHVQGMSRDTALMEVFGPNPDIGVEVVRQALDRIGAKTAKTSGEITSAKAALNGFYDDFTGRAWAINNETMSKVSSNVRGFLVAAQLGSAMMAAITDIPIGAITSFYNGVGISKFLKNYFKAMGPTDVRRQAKKLALYTEILSGNMIAQSRYNVSIVDTLGSKVANVTLGASLLTRHTESGQLAFSMAMASEIAENFNKSWDALGKADPQLKRFLETYGVTDAKTWNVLRKIPTTDIDGIPHINLHEITKVDANLASQMHQGILNEMEFAIPTTNSRTENLLRFNRQQGTLGGEAANFFAMYKRFPVHFLFTHVNRYLKGSRIATANRVGYTASMVVVLTAFGAAIFEAKEMQKGRDPRNIKDARFWGDAFIQGGAGAVLADITQQFADAEEGRRPIESTLMNWALGPILQLGADVGGFPLFFVKDLADPKRTEQEAIDRAQGRFVKLLGEYTPGRSLWYLQAAGLKRVFEALEEEVNPAARRSHNAVKRFYKQEYDQNFYWEPGHVIPSRGPDLEKVLQD